MIWIELLLLTTQATPRLVYVRSSKCGIYVTHTGPQAASLRQLPPSRQSSKSSK